MTDRTDVEARFSTCRPSRGSSEFHLLGVSFRDADHALREVLAFDSVSVDRFLGESRSRWPSLELLVLATCNRTEFYLAGTSASLEGWHAWLVSNLPCAQRKGFGDALFSAGKHGHHLLSVDAYRHLLRVACGLESAILGDTQVLGQVRGAMAAASRAGTVGVQLNRAVAGAIRTARRARAETEINLGNPGIGRAVVAALGDHRRGPDTRVLLLGSGTAARAIGRTLRKAGYDHLVLCGRRLDLASRLAQTLGGQACSWDSMADVRPDVVIAATGAQEPVLDPAGFKQPESRQALLIIDVGFPRQVTRAPDFDVISLEDLRAGEGELQRRREAAVPIVAGHVEEEVLSWHRWHEGLLLEESIKSLHRDADLLTRDVECALGKCDAASSEQAQRVLRVRLRRMLHAHSARLRALSSPGVQHDLQPGADNDQHNRTARF